MVEAEGEVAGRTGAGPSSGNAANPVFRSQYRFVASNCHSGASNDGFVVDGERPAHERESPAVESERLAADGERLAVDGERPAVEREPPAADGEHPAVAGMSPAVKSGAA